MDYAVVHRVATAQGDAHIPVFYVLEAPEDISEHDLKQLLTDAGKKFGDGGIAWGNYDVKPENDWFDAIRLRASYANTIPEEVAFSQLEKLAESGRRITLRVSPGLHRGLETIAAAHDESLNALITRVLGDFVEAFETDAASRFLGLVLVVAVVFTLNGYINSRS